MKLSVYYDEIDGQLNPQWLLVPANVSEEFVSYSIELPFERFYPEDFHDELGIITVSQGALTKDPFEDSFYSIDINQLKNDLYQNGGNLEHLNSAELFMIRIDDLEEILQMNVKRFYIE